MGTDGDMMRLIDRICDLLAIFAGVYLVAIMLGIVFNAMARTLGFSGSSHIFTFAEFGLLYIVMAASPWLVKEKGHVFIELLTAAVPKPVQAPLVARSQPSASSSASRWSGILGARQRRRTSLATPRCARSTCRSSFYWARCRSVLL